MTRTPLDDPTPAGEAQRGALPSGGPLGLSLFWRTFILLAALSLGSMLAWLQALWALELEPRATQSAQEIASLVNLSRAALIHADAIARVSLIKTMTEQEGLRIVPRESADRYAPLETDRFSRLIAAQLRQRLGPDTVLTSQVNQEEGLWVGFDIDGDLYWLLTDPARLNITHGTTWLIWLSSAAALSLAGAALIARRVNRPLQALSDAAARVREGEFQASRLDESVATREIREVNMGFNRMAQQLAKIDQDRALMLAGISHDLRTPLARLRLETEMSVADPQARAHMVADMEQMDRIIGKFLDYARPGPATLHPVSVNEVARHTLHSLSQAHEVRLHVNLPPQLWVMADAVELGRVLSNLLENARRYGKTPQSGQAHISLTGGSRGDRVWLEVRDQGQGVTDDDPQRLVQPFLRGNTARTEATGAGLGLAIVEQTMRRLGGSVELINHPQGGLLVRLELQRADPPAQS